MHPVGPRYEELPGTLRTHAVADGQLSNQLAYAEFRSSPTMWVAVLPGLFLLPMIIGGPILFLVISGPSTWQYFTATSGLILVASPLVAAALLLGLPVLGSIARGRWVWRSELPAGTPIYADFGPEWIGIGWPSTYRTVMLTQLRRVRQVGTTLVLSGGGNTVLLPGELVPAHVAADLLSGAWRQRIGAPMSQQLRPGPEQQPAAHRAQPPADGTIRTQGVADDGLADRLAVATRRSPAMRLVLILMVLMPVVGVLIMRGRYGEVDLAMLLPLVAVFGSGGAVLGYFMLYGTAAKLRQLVPPGAPLMAEFGPDWIGLRLGGHVQTAQTADIKRVDEISGALVLTMRGLRQGMLIPTELVPAQIGAELFGRYGS